MHSIYVVKYSDNKYIIQRTKREVIIGSQLNSGEVVDVIKSDDEMDVDKITKKYMMKYGIKNVQGGSYADGNLKDWQIKALEHEFESLKPKVINIKPSEYLNKFTTIKEIDYEITFLKKICNQMIDLEIFIEEYNKLNINMNLLSKIQNSNSKNSNNNNKLLQGGSRKEIIADFSKLRGNRPINISNLQISKNDFNSHIYNNDLQIIDIIKQVRKFIRIYK